MNLKQSNDKIGDYDDKRYFTEIGNKIYKINTEKE